MNAKQLHTRFLWPFSIRREGFDRVETALGSSWRREDLPHLYRDDLLEQAQAFLCKDIVYLRLSDADRLFPHMLRAQLSKGVSVPVRMPSGGGIEVFVTREGVGVLSILLSLTNVTTDVMVDFNYRMARKAVAVPAKLHVAHPAEDAERWKRISEDDRARIQDAPRVDAPPGDRIGAQGGTYTLGEVIAHVTAPLERFDLQGLQLPLSVYTVASFGSMVSFDKEECLSWSGPLLSALAQIEEPNHAGAKAGSVHVPNSVMNRCHWAGVGVLGAAHLTADQPPPEGVEEHPFNAERILRIRDKYFVPYLLGLIQRHVLNKMAKEAVNLVQSRRVEELRALRMSLLEFGVGGRFSQISTRHALHRYYRLVQEGLDVRDAWSDVRAALSDIDASNIAMDVANNVGVMTRLQHAAHTLEYAIISVYAAKLWHMFAAENEPLTHEFNKLIDFLLPAGRELPHHWFVSWGVLLFAALGWLAVYLYNRPKKH
jgi:hypothetical protein